MGAIAPTSRIPLWVKLAFTAFMAVLVPVYWVKWGPTNFLYFCDMALFLTLIALWTEHPLPAGMALTGIFVPQMLWVVDFTAHFAGLEVTGMTEYMFQSHQPISARCLSLFHGWLPFFLLWIVWRLGYDRRSLPAWTLLAWTAMLISWFFLPMPPPPDDNPALPVNVDYVWGLKDDKPQEWMPPGAWFAFVMVGMPLLIFAPGDLLMRRLFDAPDGIKPHVKQPVTDLTKEAH
jgi:hypothetical protein